MSDRELLELAAKAAGYTIRIEDGDIYLRIDRNAFGFQWEYWNPLTDDGDALRLAVNLGIHLNWGAGTSDGKLAFADEIDEPLGTDPLAATRRAIVRAAAEIGRAM